ncbi:MAG: adenylate/guanylate cyclase domain-containing protein [Boseongicola sp.]
MGPNDATNALNCAQEMLARLAGWNQERAKDGRPPIGIGIGLHYGPTVLGDIGSERSMAFTVIGDTVNSASRIEGLTRKLDSDLVISHALAERVREEAISAETPALNGLEEVGDQSVKGRIAKIQVLALRRS